MFQYRGWTLANYSSVLAMIDEMGHLCAAIYLLIIYFFLRILCICKGYMEGKKKNAHWLIRNEHGQKHSNVVFQVHTNTSLFHRGKNYNSSHLILKPI